jgi:hypothetical protein
MVIVPDLVLSVGCGLPSKDDVAVAQPIVWQSHNSCETIGGNESIVWRNNKDLFLVACGSVSLPMIFR